MFTHLDAHSGTHMLGTAKCVHMFHTTIQFPLINCVHTSTPSRKCSGFLQQKYSRTDTLIDSWLRSLIQFINAEWYSHDVVHPLLHQLNGIARQATSKKWAAFNMYMPFQVFHSFLALSSLVPLPPFLSPRLSDGVENRLFELLHSSHVFYEWQKCRNWCKREKWI